MTPSLRVEIPRDASPDELADLVLALSSEPGVAQSLAPFGFDLSKAIKVGGPSHLGLSAVEVESRQNKARADVVPAQRAFTNALSENFGAWDAAVSLAQAGSAKGGQLSLESAMTLQERIWRVIERDARALVRDAYRLMWKRGRETAGNFKTMSPDETRELQRMYRAQQNFFLNLLRDREHGTGTMSYARRIEMYGAALKQAFYAGQVLADLSVDVFYEWRTQPAEHCGDCLTLARGGRWNNGTYSARELAALGTFPGSGKTECLVDCKCELHRVAKPGARTTGKALSADELTGPKANSFDGNGRAGRDAFERGVKRNSWKHKGKRA